MNEAVEGTTGTHHSGHATRSCRTNRGIMGESGVTGSLCYDVCLQVGVKEVVNQPELRHQESSEASHLGSERAEVP